MAKHDRARQVYVYTWEHRQCLMQAWTPAQYTAVCALIFDTSQCNSTQWSSRQHRSCAPIGSSGKLCKWAPTWRWWDSSRATQPPALELEVPRKRNTGVSHCFRDKKRKELTCLTSSCCVYRTLCFVHWAAKWKQVQWQWNHNQIHQCGASFGVEKQKVGKKKQKL